ncbi:hypothetical protein ACYX34_13600 [Nitrospira sp. CMX1]
MHRPVVEPRTTTDIDILILLDPPSQETIQSFVSSVFTSAIIHPSFGELAGLSNPSR